MVSPRTFQCAACGKTFTSSDDQEDVDQQHREEFGFRLAPSVASTVCSRCYDGLIAALRSMSEAERQQLKAEAKAISDEAWKSEPS